MADTALELKRELGLRDLILFNVAAVVSTRWIGVAAHAGSGALTLWAFAGIFFLVPCALVVAQLSRRFPEQGGFYVWTREAFGEWHAYVCGLFYFVNNLFWIPGVLIATVGMVASSVPPLAARAESPEFVLPVALVLLLLIVTANYVGLRVGKWVDNLGGVSVCLIWLCLVGAAVVIFFHRGSATRFQLSPNWDWQKVNFWSQMAFGMTGLELSPIISGEIRDPRRTIFRATWISALLVMLFYIAGTGAILAVLPPNQVSPVIGLTQAGVQVANETGAQWLPLAIALGIVLSLGGQLGTYIGACARLPFVIGIGNLLPPVFARLHPRYQTPYLSILILGIGSAVLLLISQMGETFRAAYQTTIDLSVITLFIPFLYIFAAAWKFGQRVSGALGLGVSALAIIFSFIPTADVISIWRFEAKLLGGCVLLFVIARLFYRRYRTVEV
jgi:glutamate:GABA antiporter